MSKIGSHVLEVGIKTNGSEQTVSAFKNMSTSAKNLSNDIKGVTKETELLATTAKMTEKYFQLKDAKANVKSLQKEIENLRKTNAEAAKDKESQLAQEQANVKRLNEEYKALGKVATNQAKEMVNVQEQMGGTGAGGGMGLGNNFLGALGNGLIRMRMLSQLGQAGQEYAFALGASMYGARTGSAIKNIAGGAISGATLGMYAGPEGAAVGAAIGAATGVVQTATERLTEKDDAFRAEVENLYNKVQSDREAGLQAGIEYAATEESNLRAMGVLLGSQEKGEKLYQELKNYGINTMYQTQNMLTSAKRMLAYGVDENQIMQAVEWIGDIAMGEQSKFDSLAYVYGQTASAGKLTGQDLRQYTEAGFNPLAWLAEERGVSLEAMREEMSAGKVLYQDVMHAFELATAEGAKFGGSAEKMMDTYAGKMSKLADIQADIEGGYGRGYNKEREKGLNAELDRLEGDFGGRLEKANELIGAYEADLENQHQKYLLDAQEALLNDKDFIRISKQNAPLAGEMMQEAITHAEIEWQNSEGMQLKREAELALVQGIGQDAAINGAYIEFGVHMADAFTVGWSGRLQEAFGGDMMSPEKYVEESYRAGGFMGVFKQASIAQWLTGAAPLQQALNNRYYQTNPMISTQFNTPNYSAFNNVTVPKNETVNETQNNHQTFNISTSVTVNEATDGAKIASMIAATVGKGITSTATKSAAMPKFTLRRGH